MACALRSHFAHHARTASVMRHLLAVASKSPHYNYNIAGRESRKKHHLSEHLSRPKGLYRQSPINSTQIAAHNPVNRAATQNTQ